ncbi:MAG TPA: hypothetical protein VKU83_01005, partial [Puia sp.]|nr:hypothetical protein [Puia sp.]
MLKFTAIVLAVPGLLAASAPTACAQRGSTARPGGPSAPAIQVSHRMPAIVPGGSPADKRPIRPADLYRLPGISDPQPSPDGKWISYTLSTIDSLKDTRNSDIWMISWDGTQDIQLTNSPEGESHARWSPDGRYLSFLSGRQASGADGNIKGSQVWLMDRRGGE